ncbi:MAG: phosphate acyltransferase [Bacteroides sp.]|nr:phosphate acyltransferase [Bacteroides sp.]MCM1414188.1 phosphate acyltransferase [Bacteroides sp.]MCM1472010.1 phosphate acyltransferase [Bacteroides sp.]
MISFDELIDHFSKLRPKKRVAVVAPHDDHTREVVERCLDMQLAEFRLVCVADRTWAEGLAGKYDGVNYEVVADLDTAAARGVELVRNHRADVLMKGAINTDNLLKAVLNKATGLLPEGKVLTHVTAAKIDSYDKMIFFSDAAVIPYPDFDQFEAMIGYDVALLKKLNIRWPKVALIHFTEKVNPRFAYTLDYEKLKAMAADGKFGEGVTIDGPMDVKSACDAQSADIKHIESAVCGHADLLIFPDLASANTFYKTISLFCHAPMAGILCGAVAPIVIPSRADSAQSKFYSLILACTAHT